METRLFKAVGLFLLLISSAVFAKENEVQPIPWSPEDKDIRILEIRVGPYTLEEIVAAY